MVGPVDWLPALMRRAATGVGVLAAYTLLAIAMTWPLAAQLGSAIGGEIVDPAQTLWGFWWWRHSGDFGSGPMSSPMLWWPHGVPLWFQSWDIPSAFAAWPLWGIVPDTAIYNLLVLATFPLSGLAMSLLGRELWGGRLAPFLAGCLYTFSTYHFAHARMQLHLSSMQWAPLVFLAIVRLARRPRMRDAIVAGAALALATLASVYYLLFAGIGLLVLAMLRLSAERREIIARVGLRRAAASLAVFLALAGGLLAGMARSYLAEPYVGSHRAAAFSADLQSFVVPNAISLWSRWFPASGAWTGNHIEISGYVGYVALALALAGAWWTRAARHFLWVAIAGVVLALGPFLRVGGSVLVPVLLPEGWLELLLPPLRMSGMPARYGWLTTFGVAVAAGAGLSRLCRRGRAGCAVAVGLIALAMVEVWPRPFPMTAWTRPAIFDEWSEESGRDWAVLDATPWSRGLWHQMAHRRPMVTGYVTRTPARLWDRVRSDPVLGPLLAAQFGGTEGVRTSPQAAMDAFGRYRIRFLILTEEQTNLIAGLNLPVRFRGHGLVIYSVE